MKTYFSPIKRKNKTAETAIHVVFWMVAYLFFITFFGRTNQNYRMTFIFVSTLFPVAIATTYLLIYYLIPRYLLNGRPALFFLLLVYLIIITGWISELISIFIFMQIANYQVQSMIPVSFDIFSLIVGLYFIILIAVAINQAKLAFRMQQQNAELEHKKLSAELKLKEAELKLLKAQIHPHFLFNTLNNLYGLALEKSDLAPDLVLRLSDLLDYMLYQCSQPHVSLKNELKHLHNYIRIEQIRYGSGLKLEINQKGESDSLQIAPMLLLPFIENAFKHGISKQVSNPFVRISIDIQNEYLKFKIENSKANGVSTEENYTKGIGLKNVIKRLELLYKDKYKLDIVPENTFFTVNFEISLSQTSEKL